MSSNEMEPQSPARRDFLAAGAAAPVAGASSGAELIGSQRSRSSWKN